MNKQKEQKWYTALPDSDHKNFLHDLICSVSTLLYCLDVNAYRSHLLKVEERLSAWTPEWFCVEQRSALSLYTATPSSLMTPNISEN